MSCPGSDAKVHRLRSAMERVDEVAAVVCMAAMIHAPSNNAGEALLSALNVFHNSPLAVSTALCALDKVWGGGEEGADAVLRAMRHGDLMVAQAGLRVLKKHLRREGICQTPRVALAVLRAYRRHKNDVTVKQWAAEGCCLLAGIDPESIAAAHGEIGRQTVEAVCVTLANSTPRAHFFVGGEAWEVIVSSLYPRLRRR